MNFREQFEGQFLRGSRSEANLALQFQTEILILLLSCIVHSKQFLLLGSDGLVIFESLMNQTISNRETSS